MQNGAKRSKAAQSGAKRRRAAQSGAKRLKRDNRGKMGHTYNLQKLSYIVVRTTCRSQSHMYTHTNTTIDNYNNYSAGQVDKMKIKSGEKWKKWKSEN